MQKLVLLSLMNKMVEDKFEHLASNLINQRGPRGFQGPPGQSFVFEDHEATIKEWVASLTPTFDKFTPEQLALITGPAGKDFVFDENSEKINFLVEKYVNGLTEKLRLKFEDLTEDQIASLKGGPGRDGRDGKSFEFEAHSEKIKDIIHEFVNSISDGLKLKFEDLTDDQIASLKGNPGRDGRDGAAGKSFDFEEHREFFEGLKLKFSDLTEAEKDQLRGLRGEQGPAGSDGKGFDFAEHEEFFKSLKFRFEDFTDAELEQLKGRPGRDGAPGRGFIFEDHEETISEILTSALASQADGLKLKFSDLSEDEVDKLRLKFADLTLDERMELKGPRGQRGRNGSQGEIGEKGDKGDQGEPGKQGLKGEQGPIGMRGLPGVAGPRGHAGVKGDAGKNAPKITSVEVEEFHNEIRFVFTMSDGSIFKTQWVELPQGKTASSIIVGSMSNTPSAGGSGNLFEKVPVTLVANVWQAVTPSDITAISDCEVYDAFAEERVYLDVKFNPTRSQVELRSKVSETFTLFLEGT